MNQFNLLRSSMLASTAIGLVLIAGCSALQEDKVDYSGAKRISALDVPPDLSQLTNTSPYARTNGMVSASSTASQNPSKVIAPDAAGDVKLERSGSQRWLVVQRTPEQIWPVLKDFWQENGFNLAREQANLGIIETDWAENRAKLPQDMLRKVLGSVLNSLYSTGEKDQFRTRIERTGSNQTQIFISHKGMIEVYTGKGQDQTAWQARPSDLHLETEFLQRLMVKLGSSKDQAAQQVTANTYTPKARKVTLATGMSGIEFNESYDRAWRRVGLALDRSGFTIEDQNRNEGVYFIRYADSATNKANSKPGFFNQLFGSASTDTGTKQYRIALTKQDTATLVTVLNDANLADNSQAAERIFNLLIEELR